MKKAVNTRAQDVLSLPAEGVLMAFEMTSYAREGDPLNASIHDADGDFVVVVSRAISAFDLRAVISYGRHCHALGHRLGAEGVKASLRSLIGAAAEPEPQR